jgi:hypothetical protein
MMCAKVPSATSSARVVSPEAGPTTGISTSWRAMTRSTPTQSAEQFELRLCLRSPHAANLDVPRGESRYWRLGDVHARIFLSFGSRDEYPTGALAAAATCAATHASQDISLLRLAPFVGVLCFLGNEAPLPLCGSALAGG